MDASALGACNQQLSLEQDVINALDKMQDFAHSQRFRMARLTVASYCTTFLKPEMLHIYRQVTSLRRAQTFVMTKRVEHPRRFPLMTSNEFRGRTGIYFATAG